ncbi:PTS sugar transporter subunit IIA [Bacillus sp. Y1]|jgi:galactitol PTS system EIIA component|uniref:PTS sugar transporter subunit IIA n=1 Tax=Robertmurraya sp. TaxID=2837525 RepID=UPI000E6B3C9A|nr:PTS sugar transporter subunit IIA [Bacillus sp. Y1]AYA77517.1 PTS sugar transporter subunit IIA [Bacillus sp. Y1]
MGKLINLDEKVVRLNVKAKNSDEVIAVLCEELKKLNYVKDSFLPAILEREKVFSTGLPLATMGVAIPHTDPEHVISPMISVAILENPVEFKMMGSPETSVNVEIVLMLAITEPSKQLVMLERLMDVFQNEAAMSQLKDAQSAKEVVDILDKELNQISV